MEPKRMKILFTLFMLTILSGCGFTPVYTTDEVIEDLPKMQISVTEAHREFDVMAKRLQLRLNEIFDTRQYDEISSPYKLEVTLSVKEDKASVQPDSIAQNYAVIVNAKYKLTDPKGIILAQRNTKILTRFDAVKSLYATSIDREDALFGAVDSLSQDIKIQVISHILKAKKQQNTLPKNSVAEQ
jgi:outer membrane lipopolysaccharide assembly protein LptE/RlpB